MSAWAEAKTPDGRIYYWNKETKETKWDKPADFASTPAQDPAAVDAAWNETTAPGGRKYYYNSITRQTVWDPPEAFLRAQQSNQQAAAPAFVAGGGGGNAHGAEQDGFHDRRLARRDHGLPQKPAFEREGRGGGGGGQPWDNRPDPAGFRGAMPIKIDQAEYATEEEAEQAFFNLLKKHGITADTPWTECLAKVIKERDFRAIKGPKERLDAWQKYCETYRREEKVREQERKQKLREDYRQMLTMHDEIVHFTRWKTARPLIEREAAFKNVSDEEDRTRMFFEYKSELKKRHEQQDLSLHATATNHLESLLGNLIVDNMKPWEDAKKEIMSNERYASEEAFRPLDEFDVFEGFKKRIFQLDNIRNEEKQRMKELKFRSERKARDAFKDLLGELRAKEQIRGGTYWKSIRPVIEKDPRYIAMLGNPGSTPLDLFFDIVAEENKKLRSKRNAALDVLEEQRFELVINTTLEEFTKIMRFDPKTAELTPQELQDIYKQLMDKVKKRAEDRSEKSERNIRRAIDGLRSAMKRLEPSIRLGESYEDVEPRMRDIEEYRILEEQDRRRAFDKYMDRLEEKGEDYRRAHRDSSRRDIDPRRRRTRSPEVDAYEADRRKAQAVREKHYRKASFGLSPPPSSRDSRRRPDYDSVYERERRERELERERNYISRADPRDKGRSLDYGDDDAAGSSNTSRPGSASIRKRRESDAGSASEASRRDNKRPRRGTRRTPDVEAASTDPDRNGGTSKKAAQEEVELQSGSEEGEIEEV